jgi:hypothetical protein
MASTIFPNLNVTDLFTYLSLVFLASLAGVAIYALRNRSATAGVDIAEISTEKRATWTMPPLALLERPVWSPGRKAGMLVLRGYLVVAVLLLVVKTFQLGH